MSEQEPSTAAVAEKPAEAPAAPASGLPEKLLGIGFVLGMLGLILAVVHFVVPIAAVFLVFWVAGQGLLAAGMVLYAIALLADLRRRKVI